MSSSPTYQIRDCTSLEDYNACLNMQREVWQFADLDITPLRSFVITRTGGGFTLGAFAEDDGRLLGFAHALAAFDEQNRPYFYSQMLAVSPQLQNAGIGMELKFAQRRRALERGIPLMVWTFDPLQSRNAYLNIVKLGAVVRKYKVNYYGHYSSSVLHRGLDSDRLLAEWWVESPRVRAIAETAGKIETPVTPVASVEVPFEIEALKTRNLDEARAWQLKIRAEFEQHLAAGLYCADFVRGNAHTPSRYLFFPDEGTR
ncbi:MAG TPA: GNAT family N-acetyltransferase [Blastocatellia bacterium]|nr:GNAT family N-acetyltransferase [Blastocatellia bacterium]